MASFGGLLLLGVDDGVSPSIELFTFGTVASISVEPYNLDRSIFGLSSEEPFDLLGNTRQLMEEPFDLQGFAKREMVEVFSLFDSTVGVLAPSDSPVLTADALAGDTVITVDQTTSVIDGSTIIINNQAVIVISHTIDTITFNPPLEVDAGIGTIAGLEGFAPAAPLYGWWETDEDEEESVGSVVTD